MTRYVFAASFATLAISLTTAMASDEDTQSPTYEETVRELIRSKCVDCHDAETKESGLDLSSPEGILRGSESGRVVVAGDTQSSLLLKLISTGKMPPEKADRLTEEQVAAVRLWISGGAKFREPVQHHTEITQHDVLPLLHLRCVVCHGGRERKGGLDLRTRASILQGGASGPACIPGDPEKSLMIQRVHSGEMPPKRELVKVSVKPMPQSELDKLAKWIEQRLPESPSTGSMADESEMIDSQDREFWSFQSPRRPQVPNVEAGSRVRNPIDAFILRKLETGGLTLAAEADRATLLRRITFDLTGLPPTPDELDAFLGDDDPRAYEKVVDRLLESPRHGERWGRYWLDAAGYADSEGAQNEDRIRHHIYRYRDYVIRSFNDDKPYSRFLLEQLAGDELADYSDPDAITPEIYDNLVATGFLRTAPDRTFANITNFVPDRLEVIADEIDILSSAVMGLTLKCARCHSHKFDPISQRDYYRLTAVLKDALDEHDWLKSDGGRTLTHVLPSERQEFEQRRREIDQEVASLREQIKKATREEKPKLEQQLKQLEGSRPREPRIRALWSRGTPSPSYMLKRGDYQSPGHPVSPGVPAVFASDAGFGSFPGLIAETKQRELERSSREGSPLPTYRRLAFARWLTRPDHPLTARVMVNRIWMHHFGRGIVSTPANFGKAGQPPTHPELLDWLAKEFVDAGWSIKAMHRLIVTSSTYRQTSSASEASLKLDPDGALYSRSQTKRLEAEAIRDSLLLVAGRLDETRFGPADPVDVRADGLATSTGWRRSIYVLQRRTQIPTLLDSFDFPQMGPNCIQRGGSLVAPQALHMMNDALVHQLAGHFAEQMLRTVDSTLKALVTRIYRHAFSRSPNTQEVAAGVDAIAELSRRWRSAHPGESDEVVLQQATTTYCHAIINLAEFIYVE